MKVNVNTFATLQHYSHQVSLKGRIIAFKTNIVKVKLVDCSDTDNFFKNDPVVLYFSSEGNVCVGNCEIAEFDKEEQVMTLNVEKYDYLKEKRISERFPLSKVCNIQIGQSLTRHPAIIKNISFNGIMFICESDFPIYQKLKIIFDIGTPIELSAIVIRKRKLSSDKLEYGLKIVYIDENTPKLIRSYLIKLKRGL